MSGRLIIAAGAGAVRIQAVPLTTHYLEEVDRLWDRLAIVDHGRIVAEGAPSELKAQIQGDLVALNVNGAAPRTADLLRGNGSVLEIISDGDEVIARVDQIVDLPGFGSAVLLPSCWLRRSWGQGQWRCPTAWRWLSAARRY